VLLPGTAELILYFCVWACTIRVTAFTIIIVLHVVSPRVIVISSIHINDSGLD
jgi:hypothetical protein